jgi:hypothetical protein
MMISIYIASNDDYMYLYMGSECADCMLESLDKAAASGETVNLEEKFNSVSLDIIGKAVFNYDFGSVTKESPVIKAAYACLVLECVL